MTTDVVVFDSSLQEASELIVDSIVNLLGIKRNALASNDQIKEALERLPRLLGKPPDEYLNELFARMCVAATVGLFDSVVNYVWNATIIHLRDRIRSFGVSIINSITENDLAEESLHRLKDFDLLKLCLDLSLITPENYFFLDQTRETRNKFSAAHPSTSMVDEYELINIINRCVTHGFLGGENLQGIDVQEIFNSLKQGAMSDEQITHWANKLEQTNESQRRFVFQAFHSKYCNPSLDESQRTNALNIMLAYKKKKELSVNEISVFVLNHEKYVGAGDESKSTASTRFFEHLGLVGQLSSSARHALFAKACNHLWIVHLGHDNFYNEPPFAERLYDITQQGEIPDSVKVEFVTTVVGCAIGNGYGVSNDAFRYYKRMIQSFSPREVSIMLSLPDFESSTEQYGQVSRRIHHETSCKRNFFKLIKLIDESSVVTQQRSKYEKYLSNNL